jgi:hypothetical protein
VGASIISEQNVDKYVTRTTTQETVKSVVRSADGASGDPPCLEGRAGRADSGEECAKNLGVRRKHLRRVPPGAGSPANARCGGGFSALCVMYGRRSVSMAFQVTTTTSPHMIVSDEEKLLGVVE